MIKNIKWQSGAPSKPGIYWCRFIFDKFTSHIFILKALEYDSKIEYFTFHNCGSAPLDYFISENNYNKIRYSKIEKPKEWYTVFSSKKLNLDGTCKFWLTTKESNKKIIGLALGEMGSHGFYGTIIWKNKPKSFSDSGIRISYEDKNYMFSSLLIIND